MGFRAYDLGFRVAGVEVSQSRPPTIPDKVLLYPQVSPYSYMSLSDCLHLNRRDCLDLKALSG